DDRRTGGGRRRPGPLRSVPHRPAPRRRERLTESSRSPGPIPRPGPPPGPAPPRRHHPHRPAPSAHGVAALGAVPPPSAPIRSMPAAQGPQANQGRLVMARMRAVDAIVLILEKEGATQAFGLPGAASNPLYSAMKNHGGINHVLARHVEGASHMADGYSRTHPGNIGVCMGTSGPAGTDMITGLYAAIGDSIPMLCITGQVHTPLLDKEAFQAVDIESIAEPVAKMSKTVLEAAQVPQV